MQVLGRKCESSKQASVEQNVEIDLNEEERLLGLRADFTEINQIR